MFKKIIGWTLVAGSIAAIGYVFFFLKKDQQVIADPFTVVPSTASLVVELKLDSTFGQWQPWLEKVSHNNLSRIEGISLNPIAELPALISKLDSLKLRNENWRTALSSSSVLFISPANGKSSSWSLIIGVNKNAGSEELKSLFSSFDNVKSQRDFAGTEISEGENVKMALVENCVVISSESSLMEEIILQAKKKVSLVSDPNFTEALKVKSWDVPIHFFAAMEGVWLQLDPEKIENEFHVSGYFINDSTNTGLKAIGEKTQFELPHFLLSSNYLDVSASDDFESGWKREEEANAQPDALKYWSRAWKDLGDSCQCDLNEAMLSWRGGVHGSGSIQIGDSTTAEFLFFQTQEGVNAMELLKPILGADTTISIANLKFSPAFERNMNSAFPVQANYITRIGNWIFVGEEKNELKFLRSQAQLTDSVELKSIPFETGRLVQQKEFYTSPLPQSLLNVFGGGEQMSTQISYFKDNKWRVDVQLSGGDQRIAIANVPAASESVTPNDSEIIAGPWSVINHSTNKKESAWQDEQNNFCLADMDGKILWKKKLGDKILGGVTQVDALKNGKLQMAFATGQKIYCLDRNGNDLPGFPVLIPAGASSPLYVFDYENNKNYRLIIGSRNGNVLNYTIEGKPTEGWKYKVHTETASEIIWKKIKGEDYLFINSVDTSETVFKRNGVEIARPK